MKSKVVPDVRRWEYRQGRITQTVRGSHVDLSVKLGAFAGRLWSTTVAVTVVCGIFVFVRVIEAFMDGRIQQFLEQVKAAH